MTTLSAQTPATQPSKALLTERRRAPYRIGLCMEFAVGTNIIGDFYDAMRLALDEAEQRGDLDRPVEVVVREVLGPMRGTSPAVVTAWRELVHDEACLAVVGPVVTEANLALVDEVNATGVPTLSFCATFDWAGPYCYSLQNGGFPDESNLLAAYLAHRGVRRVGVFHEDGIIGDEYFRAFRSAARRYGLKVVGDHAVGLFNTLEPVEPQLRSLRDAGAECVAAFTAYGALGPVQAAIQRAREEWDWHPLCIQNTTWVAVTAFGTAGDMDRAALLRDFEGWIGVDQIHEGNRTFQAMLDRFEARHGRRPFHCYAALGFDHGVVVADALSRMKPPSSTGFKHALERTRMREACIGAPGTVISFGPHDNRGYKGDYVVLRTIVKGEEQLVDTPWADVLQVEPLAVGTEEAGAAAHSTSGAGSRYSLVGDRVPFRIGVVQDWALWAPLQDWYNGLQLAFDEAFENGVVDRRIEMVVREVEGPPDGPAAAVLEAWRELVREQQVLATVGPFITDTTRILRDHVERERVPCLSYCATVQFDGDYCFQLPNGTFADETYLVARHLVRRGARTVGVVREDNPIGDEYYDFFRQHARRLGLSIASDQIVSPRVTADGMHRSLAAIRAAGADSVAHLGYGLSFYAVLEAMHDLVERDGWDVPRVTITTWVMCSGLDAPRGSPTLMGLPVPVDQLEGWVGVDLPHEGNRVFQAYLDRYVRRFGGQPPMNCYPAHMYDIGRFLAEGIARSRPVTPKGLRHGLEQVRMLPATMGGPGTVISAAPYDHRCYKGADYLVLRGCRGGREGLAEDLLADLLR